jgi:hypothetical protein
VWIAATLLLPMIRKAMAQTAVVAKDSPIALIQAAPLRYGVDAWPLIDHPATPAAMKVNARLTHLNLLMERSLKDCDAGYNNALQQMGPAAKGQDPASKDTNRSITVTMRGPRYLSMVARDFADCGGAHPSTDTEVMVFDLKTGAPVNWMALIAKSANASSYTDTVMDGTTAGAIVLPALSKMYIAAADKDCTDAFEDSQSFLIWPDATKGTLDVEAFDLPHVVAACGTEMDLSLKQARELGFKAVLLDAISAAKAP